MNNMSLNQLFHPLWLESLGNSVVCVAVLDGPVDLTHPCFDGSDLTILPTLVPNAADQGSASQHGTHVASIIFGQHHSHVTGVAPRCRGLIIPIFTDGSGGEPAPCSQIDLARAITQAVEYGANVINISGGQLAASPESDKLLLNAIRLCQEKDVLIVAAAGNNGCECLHVPAALESVLAVGAMDYKGQPLEFSNWGKAYQERGILALGENIPGAVPGGGTALKSGTSFAAPIVSGIAALLLSIQLKRGKEPAPYVVRDAILQSSMPCLQPEGLDKHRCLSGTLNIPGAYALITQGGTLTMSNDNLSEVSVRPNEAESLNQLVQPIDSSSIALEDPIPLASSIGIQAAESKFPSLDTSPLDSSLKMVGSNNASVPSVIPSGAAGDCGCGGGQASQIVYALGELGIDYGSEARRDSFTQYMPSNTSLLEYFNQAPWEAQSVIWTLNLDATPIYAIVPSGPYASAAYDRLRSFHADPKIEKISIPGYIGGNVRLMSGQVVPVIIPELRGMFSWTVPDLATLVMNAIDSTPASKAKEATTGDQYRIRIEDYLNRIYYDYRNLGVTPQERALNFSATNAFQASSAIISATGDNRVLDQITVEKSPICRPDSDCYDVKLTFFDPENNQRSNRIYRFTIDVSDVIPVTIGDVRSWSQS
jgi:cyanobactin maturation PatA/PatG family protease